MKEYGKYGLVILVLSIYFSVFLRWNSTGIKQQSIPVDKLVGAHLMCKSRAYQLDTMFHDFIQSPTQKRYSPKIASKRVASKVDKPVLEVKESTLPKLALDYVGFVKLENSNMRAIVNYKGQIKRIEIGDLVNGFRLDSLEKKYLVLNHCEYNVQARVIAQY